MYRKIILFSYLAGMLLLVGLPLNDTASSFLTNNYVVRIRMDYLLHVFLFLPFLLFFKLAYPVSKAIWLVLMGIFFAGFCEGIQYLLPYRSFNINDLIANIAGVIFGLILIIPAVLKKIFRSYPQI